MTDNDQTALLASFTIGLIFVRCGLCGNRYIRMKTLYVHIIGGKCRNDRRRIL